MNPLHLRAALIVLLLVAGMVGAGDLYAHGIESRYVHALAPELFDQKNQGSALQQEAFRQADLLPVYGSSELIIADPHHAATLFRDYPTGFTVFAVGKPATTSLVILQKLAAVGHALRGKKVAIFVSPSWFVATDQLDPAGYAGNFSRLDAGELAFSTALSFTLKQRAARRMLAFPATLAPDPLLRAGLEALADGSPLSQVLYDALLPLGALQNLLLRLQDDWETLTFILQQAGLTPDQAHHPAALDWAALIAQTGREYPLEANNNPFGFSNHFWQTSAAEVREQRHILSDATFLKHLGDNTEWTDLDLLLSELRELGAQPLLLNMPINGTYSDFLGVSKKARDAYYAKLRAAVRPYSVPLLDFADHDSDKYFLIDVSYHLSPKGWLYFDQALDAFYHGTLPAP